MFMNGFRKNTLPKSFIICFTAIVISILYWRPSETFKFMYEEPSATLIRHQITSNVTYEKSHKISNPAALKNEPRGLEASK